MGRRRRERAFTVAPALRDANTGTAPLAAVFSRLLPVIGRIIEIPDPELREHSAPVGEITPDIVRLAGGMFDTMHANACIGLAAPQIWVHASSTRAHGARGPLVHRAGWHGGGHSLEDECRKLDPLVPRSDGDATVLADLWPMVRTCRDLGVTKRRRRCQTVESARPTGGIQCLIQIAHNAAG